jgi:hypothetical protein
VFDSVLLSVEQILASVACRLRAIELILTSVAQGVLLIKFALPEGVAHRLHEPARIRARVRQRPAVIELTLIVVDLGGVVVGDDLLTVGDALVQVHEGLILVELSLV